jgi:hypothetical protein
MKRLFAFAATLVFASASALAGHCPMEMKKIDDAMAKNPKLSEAQMKEVKSLRAEGETLHKAGKHTESLASLDKAKKILNIEDAKK